MNELFCSININIKDINMIGLMLTKNTLLLQYFYQIRHKECLDVINS